MVKILILAGGQGKRMKSELPKVLVPFRGQPMIKYLLAAIRESCVCERPAIVVGYQAQAVKNELGDDYDYVYQAEQLGTGHAVACAKECLEGAADNILILYGDHPFVSADTIKKITNEQQRNNSVLTMAIVKVPDFKDWRAPFYQFGRIIRDESGKIKEIIELKDCAEEQKQIAEVNPSYFCFKAGWLWDNISKLKNNNAQKEYYLTDLVGMAVAQKEKISFINIEPREALGINTIEQLESVQRLDD